jgi:hypothetical protein
MSVNGTGETPRDILPLSCLAQVPKIEGARAICSSLIKELQLRPLHMARANPSGHNRRYYREEGYPLVWFKEF